MSFEYLADPAKPAWAGALPGRPQAFFLRDGEGEHAKLFADTFSVLLSGDETEGQFGMFTATCPAGDIIPDPRARRHPRDLLRPRRKGPAVPAAARRGEDLPAARPG